MGKFEHGVGTQLGPVLLWRRVRSGGLMLAAWSHQTTAAGGRKGYFSWSHQTTAAGLQEGNAPPGRQLRIGQMDAEAAASEDENEEGEPED